MTKRNNQKKTTPTKGKNRRDGEQCSNSITGFLSTVCPYPKNPDPNNSITGFLSTAVRFPLRDACEVGNSCGGMSLKTNLGYFHVDSHNPNNPDPNNPDPNNPDPKKVLVDVEYEKTLSDWLSTDPDKWSPEYAEYAEHSVGAVITGWNLRRPTKSCLAVIRGMIKALNDFHRVRDTSHGNMRDENSYLLFKEKTVLQRGSMHTVRNVMLINPDRTEGKGDKWNDFKDLEYVIFKSILKLPRNSLPEIWKDLQRRMQFIDVKQPLDMEFIQDHPATWDWERRCDFFTNLWLRIHQSNALNKNGQIRSAIANTQLPYKYNWRDCVPQGTPLDTFYNRSGHDFGDGLLELFRYVRHLFQHLHEFDRESNGYKYIIIPEEVSFLDNQFLEVVVAECFPNFQVDVLKQLQDANLI